MLGIACRAADAEGVVNADLMVDNGKLARVIRPGGQRDDGIPSVDIGGRQVWPTLIDIHTHLDKGHTIERSPNVDGTFHNARLAAAADRPNWTVPDVRSRMDFGLRCGYAHGVSAIRTHIDTYHETIDRNWQALREMREEWRARSIFKRCRCARSICWWTNSATGLLRRWQNRKVLLGGVTRAVDRQSWRAA